MPQPGHTLVASTLGVFLGHLHLQQLLQPACCLRRRLHTRALVSDSELCGGGMEEGWKWCVCETQSGGREGARARGRRRLENEGERERESAIESKGEEGGRDGGRERESGREGAEERGRRGREGASEGARECGGVTFFSADTADRMRSSASARREHACTHRRTPRVRMREDDGRGGREHSG
eukprot:3657206-Rhodomonas_salina.2